MKEITQIENYDVEIWRRPYQRSIKLGVHPDGRLRVTCGLSVPQREILRFVLDSRTFIEKRLLDLEDHRRRYPEKQYQSGETFLYFGRNISLEVIWSWQKRIKVAVIEDHLEMVAPVTSSKIERGQSVCNFFKTYARTYLPERVKFYAAQMDVWPAQLVLRGQRTRWGSCSSEGQVSLNWKLLAAPKEVIDYVVVHELSHLVHMNHSPRFWNLVGQYHSEWKAARQWLKENEFGIGVQFPKPR